VGSEQFSFNGRQMLVAGFSAVFPVTVMSPDDEIPEVKEGTSYPIVEVIATTLRWSLKYPEDRLL